MLTAEMLKPITDSINSDLLIPSNPVSAFAEGNMLQVLVFALHPYLHRTRIYWR